MASVSLPDNEQIPDQEIILPDGIQTWTNLPSWLFTRKISTVSGELDGQSVGITYEYDQQLNTLKITDELGRVVEGYCSSPASFFWGNDYFEMMDRREKEGK